MGQISSGAMLRERGILVFPKLYLYGGNASHPELQQCGAEEGAFGLGYARVHKHAPQPLS
ncbi:MAG: hypothetical protein CM15mP84_01510 [Cellvibrionales bacterium]|nr:MAG: hypothetical protein CM15mP84_01510 [Cellvibrionales bacterium]